MESGFEEPQWRLDADGSIAHHEWIVHPDDFEDGARKILNWILHALREPPWAKTLYIHDPIVRWVRIKLPDRELLRVESVGNGHLRPEHRLSIAEEESLDRLGWNPPSSDPRRSGNYWREWHPVAAREAAAVTATTLFVVHRYATAKRWGGRRGAD